MKNPILVVSLVLLLCFAFSCQNKAEKAELEKFRAQAALEEQNVALVKQMVEAFTKGDYEAVKNASSPGFVWYIPSKTMIAKSQEEMIGIGKQMLKAFPDLAISIEEAYATGNRVAIRYKWRATHQGEWEGIPETGNKLELTGTGIWRIENGKVTENREDFDTLGFMTQLGMELKPKEVKK